MYAGCFGQAYLNGSTRTLIMLILTTVANMHRVKTDSRRSIVPARSINAAGWNDGAFRISLHTMHVEGKWLAQPRCRLQSAFTQCMQKANGWVDAATKFHTKPIYNQQISFTIRLLCYLFVRIKDAFVFNITRRALAFQACAFM